MGANPWFCVNEMYNNKAMMGRSELNGESVGMEETDRMNLIEKD